MKLFQLGLNNIATKRFNQILGELALNPENKSVGSKLGGNEKEFLLLTSMHHELTSSGISIMLHKGVGQKMIYDERFFENHFRIQVREHLSKICSKIKYDPFIALNKSIDFFKNKPLHPHYSIYYYEGVSMKTNLAEALVLGAKFASQLDQGDSSSVDFFGKYLLQFPPGLTVYVLRHRITAQRIAKHKLDEHPIFGKVIKEPKDFVCGDW